MQTSLTQSILDIPVQDATDWFFGLKVEQQELLLDRLGLDVVERQVVNKMRDGKFASKISQAIGISRPEASQMIGKLRRSFRRLLIENQLAEEFYQLRKEPQTDEELMLWRDLLPGDRFWFYDFTRQRAPSKPSFLVNEEFELKNLQMKFVSLTTGRGWTADAFRDNDTRVVKFGCNIHSPYWYVRMPIHDVTDEILEKAFSRNSTIPAILRFRSLFEAQALNGKTLAELHRRFGVPLLSVPNIYKILAEYGCF